MTTRYPSLWDFSLTLYQQPHIEALCLLLQDQWQANVNIILWLQWLELQGIALNEIQLASALQKIDLWHTDVVTPLRNLRRQMKISGFEPNEATERLRQTVKSTELMAEKVEQDWLSEISGDWDNTHPKTSPGANLNLYLTLLQIPEQVIEQAVNAFSTT